jgi:UDP-N-acetylmuramoyl-tripeptide--D-alanyl-D-alanine ligase|tara:strand:- start:3420 stop:4787 length:1368 start_codon:yes stop_codon:yes gene_type:complete
VIAPLNLKSLQQEFSWQLIGANCSFDSVSIDTRTLQSGDLYVALVGDNFDGHDFVAAAIAKGACAVLSSKKLDIAVSQLIVSDTRLGLAMLANVVRKQFNGILVSLTGSAGKTTVKEMLAAIFAVKGEVLSTKGNLNNEIGVPLTLLQLSQSDDYAVIEMGAGKPGDIRYLSQITNPDIAILLNAKPVHLVGMGSVEGVAQTKGEIFESLSSKCYAVVNLDDDFADFWKQRIDTAQIVTFGINTDADVRAENIELSAYSVIFNLCANNQTQTISLPVAGAHNVANALAAAAAAIAAGLSISEIAQGLTNFTGVASRLNRSSGINGCTVIDDSYNANPEAMMAAIDVLAMQAGNHILVVGDMGELGEKADQFHFEIGQYAKQNKVSRLLAVGELSRHAISGFGDDGEWFSSQQELISSLTNSIKQSDVVLVKGSRSAAMENVVIKIMNPSNNMVGG